MDGQYHFTTSEEERAERRAKRIAARKKRRWDRRRALFLKTAPILLLLVIGGIAAWRCIPRDALPSEDDTEPFPFIPPAGEPEPEPDPPWSAFSTASSIQLGDEVGSSCAILIDMEAGTVLAEKDAYTAVSPASMTKILTILVAAEHLDNPDGSAVVSPEAIAYCFAHGCSMAGFVAGEAVPVQDLFFGTILPSGAEAAYTLAEYVAGTQEGFVALMNEKAVALGLSAHFANCVGIYDPENICSVYDMAVILKTAMDNDLCRRVLGQKTYDLPAREVREEDTTLSNWFIRRIEDHMPEGMEVLGAKTGFINESGNCAASVARDAHGRIYLCVTALGGGIWPCIYDHVALYELANQDG